MQGKYKKFAVFFILIALAGILCATRLWRVTTIPSGLHIDEAGMAYSAWCLAQYGIDRDLTPWPVYLVNFGGGQSAMYAYLCAALFRIFGYHLILVRVPAILFSLITFIFGMKLVRRIYPQSIWRPLLCGFLITVCPYFILAGRFGLDCNLMLGASMVFLYFFVSAVSSGNLKYYGAAGIFGGLLLYTYALSYMILPLFLLLCLAYTVRCGQFSLKGWAVMAVPMAVFAFPLILVQIVNLFELPEIQLGIFTITRMETYRVSEITWLTWDNFLQALRSVFLGDSFAYNSIPGVPNLYGVTIPLFFTGFCSAALGLARELKSRKSNLLSFVLLWFLAVFIFECHIDSNVNKINAVFGVTVILAVHGLAVLCGIGGKLAKALPAVICCLYAICFLQFGVYYLGGQYTRDYYPLPYFDITVTEAVSFLEENPQYKRKGTYLAESREYLALSVLCSPQEFAAGEEGSVFSYYRCGSLGEVEEGYNYIVRDIYAEYAQKLRQMGFEEEKYTGYSLFYRKE